jgi:hypothetical protein
MISRSPGVTSPNDDPFNTYGLEPIAPRRSMMEKGRRPIVRPTGPQFIEVVKQVLMKARDQRTDDDIRELLPMVRSIKFFKEQSITDISEMLDIANSLTYEFIPKGKEVFEYGSIGEKFFIIIEGEVSVIIPNPECRDFKHRYDMMMEERKW